MYRILYIKSFPQNKLKVLTTNPYKIQYDLIKPYCRNFFTLSNGVDGPKILKNSLSIEGKF